MADDWAWPALIQSLQRDIEHLRGAVDDLRRETVQSRERHRDELDDLPRGAAVILWRYHDGWAAHPDWPAWHLWTYSGRGWWFRLARRDHPLCLADFAVTSRGRVVSTDLCVRREVP